MGRTPHARAEDLAAHAGYGRKSRAGPCGSESRQFRYREVRAGDEGRNGTDLRAQGRERRRRNSAAVAPVAAPGGLLGTGGCPCAARAGRAQFQIFARIPIGATRQTEGGGQEARGGQASRGAAVQRPVRTSAGGPSARLWSPAERGAAANQGECAADALNAQPASAVAFDPIKNKIRGVRAPANRRSLLPLRDAD